MTSAEGRLKAVEEEIASIREDLSKPEPIKELPVGTVLRLKNGAKAIRLDSICHGWPEDTHKLSHGPRWVAIWGDFSGRSYASLDEMLKSRVEFNGEYTVLERGVDGYPSFYRRA